MKFYRKVGDEYVLIEDEAAVAAIREGLATGKAPAGKAPDDFARDCADLTSIYVPNNPIVERLRDAYNRGRKAGSWTSWGQSPRELQYRESGPEPEPKPQPKPRAGLLLVPGAIVTNPLITIRNIGSVRVVISYVAEGLIIEAAS